jgi:hypothetical protein
VTTDTGCRGSEVICDKVFFTSIKEPIGIAFVEQVRDNKFRIAGTKPG